MAARFGFFVHLDFELSEWRSGPVDVEEGIRTVKCGAIRNPRAQFWILSLTLDSVGFITPYPPCTRTPFHDLSPQGELREAWKDEGSIKPEVSETRVM